MKWEEKTCGHTKKKKKEANSESTLVETLKLLGKLVFLQIGNKAHETTCPCNFLGDFCKD